MSLNPLEDVNTLTFDFFGTVLDLGGSLTPYLDEFLSGKGVSSITGSEFWEQWRGRQRIEQYQDTIRMLGHSGYLPVARKAFLYVLRNNKIEFSYEEADRFMEAWQHLSPFGDSVPGLSRLAARFSLVGLSNGEPGFLEHLKTNRIKFEFDNVISVEVAGCFKPHPAVYRSAMRILGKEPGELMMVSSNSFDVMGARACGFRGAFVDRYGLPFEETQYRPDVWVKDFHELADALGCP